MTYDDLSRPPLAPASLAAALVREGSSWRAVEVVEEAPSTNALVAERARAGETPGLVVVAEHQTSGRGRLDRVWVTPPRAAVTVSFLVAPDDVPTERWPWLPLLAGVATAEAVRRTAEVDCGLKWPNDVLVGERKLAGILVERLELPQGPAAVVGIGLNVSSSEAELPVETATSLALEGAATTDRTVILRAVLRTFDALYREWRLEHGDPGRGLRDAYQRRCVTIGRDVTVALPTGERLMGRATSVDEAGRLVVESAGGTRVLGAGDVVHVRSAVGDGVP